MILAGSRQLSARRFSGWAPRGPSAAVRCGRRAGR